MRRACRIVQEALASHTGQYRYKTVSNWGYAAKGHGPSNVIAGAIRDWSNPMRGSKAGAGRIVSP